MRIKQDEARARAGCCYVDGLDTPFWRCCLYNYYYYYYLLLSIYYPEFLATLPLTLRP